MSAADQRVFFVVEVERAQTSSVIRPYCRMLQVFYYLYRRGALEELMWRPLEGNLGGMFSSVRYDDWWTANKLLYNGELEDYLDNTVVREHRQ